MSTLKTLIGLLAMPLPAAALLSLLGLLAWALAWRRSALLLLTSAPLVVLLASWAPVADRLLGPLEQRHPPVHDANAHPGVEAVVVLGSGYAPHLPVPVTGQLSDSGVVRLSEGIRLHQQHPDIPLIVSGGARADHAPIAEGYREAATALGTPDEQIIALTTARDTAQEAYATRDTLGDGARILLVTSASHMHRAVNHFQRAGLDPIAAPTRYKVGQQTPSRAGYWIPSATHLRKTERALYEYMGLVALGLDHRSD